MEVLVACIAVYLFLAAWVFDAGMDKLLFHYDRSIFSEMKDQQFWNPKLSANNKWKLGFDGSPVINKNNQRVEKFWGSSRWFVMFTDGWHLLQFFQLSCFTAAFSLMCILALNFSPYGIVATIIAAPLGLALRLFGGVIWVACYNYLFTLKKYRNVKIHNAKNRDTAGA